jgi:hypothetical protein
MPFTAYHMGAGLLTKGIAPKNQSIILFGVIQCAIDFEPLVRMIVAPESDLHQFSHTLYGAPLLGIAATIVYQEYTAERFKPLHLTNMAAWLTAIWAVLSHLILDGLYHVDLGRNYLGTADRPLTSPAMVEQLSIFAGMIGLLLLIKPMFRAVAQAAPVCLDWLRSEVKRLTRKV